MELTNEQRINLSQSDVWRALNDPDILRLCIPLCDSVEKISDREFRVSMVAAVGPVRAKFNVNLKYTALDPPASCSLVFEGQGGSAGFGKGEAQMTLAPNGAVTVLRYHVKAQVGGKLAQIGSRLVDATARKIADEFFAKFNAAAVAQRPEIAYVGEVASAAPPRPSSYYVWWLAAVVAVTGLLYLWLREA
jgi:carbon monoxide dehydrogenase subunit G